MTLTPVQPLTLIPEQLTSRRGQLSRGEAEQLTTVIRRTSAGLALLVTIAHERKAWKALGYDTWEDYVATELPIARARAYQLVETGRVVMAIAEAGGIDATTIEPPPYRTVVAVKDSLTELRRAIRHELATAETHDDVYTNFDQVVSNALDVVREQTVDTRTVTRSHTADATECPACNGTGVLGRGRRAAEMANKMNRWLARTR